MSQAGARVGRAVIALVPIGFISFFFAYPVASILWRGLSGADGERVADVLAGAALRDVVWFTLWQAVVSTVLTVLAALPITYVTARHTFPGVRLVRALVAVPFVLPTVVVAGAFDELFGRLGLSGSGAGGVDLRHTVWAILVAHVFFNVAVVTRVVGGQWRELDHRQEDAAATLGASRIRTFAAVTFPRLRPALLAASGIVFLFSFTSFGVILVLGGPTRATLETEVFRYAVPRGEIDVAAALAVVQLLAVVGLVLVNSRLQQRLGVGERRRDRARESRPFRHRRLLIGGALGWTAVVLASPLLVLVERAVNTAEGYGLDNFRRLAERPSILPSPATTALANSIRFAVIASVLAVVVGFLGAVAVVRGRRTRRLIDLGLTLPLGVSAVTLGFGILIAFDEPPIDFRSRWWITPVAHALVGIPFVLWSIVPALRSVDPRLHDAAAVLGASPWRRWWFLDAPVAARAALIGAAFAFAVSLGEFGATSFLPRQPDTITGPVALFRLLSQPGELLRGQAAALSVLLMAVTAAAAFLLELARRDETAIV